MKIFCQYHELMPLDILILKKNNKNPNRHPPDQISAISKIMKANGIRHPIVISNQSQKITKGHGRLEAAILNKWDKFPIQYQDYASEDLEYADMVADNALANRSDLDLSLINLELPALGPIDLDLLGIRDFKVDNSERKPVICKKCGHNSQECP